MQKMRVLYAEDDMVRANLVKLQVEGAGFALRIVTDGQAAWEAYLEDRPDILLLDIEMPEIDGLELTRMVRQRDWCTRILAYTSHVESERHEALIDAGVNRFLSKEEPLSLLVGYLRQIEKEITTSVNEAYLYPLSPCTTYNSSAEVLIIDGVTVPIESRRMAQLLTVLCGRFNRVVPQSMLIEKLWGKEIHGKEKMLAEHVSRLRKLLRADDSLQIYFREEGYKLCYRNLE